MYAHTQFSFLSIDSMDYILAIILYSALSRMREC